MNKKQGKNNPIEMSTSKTIDDQRFQLFNDGRVYERDEHLKQIANSFSLKPFDPF